MKKEDLKVKEVKSILLIRPHFVPVAEVFSSAMFFKNQWSNSRITFIGSRENLTSQDMQNLEC